MTDHADLRGAFMAAARKEDMAEVNRLVGQLDMNMKIFDRRTALQWASMLGLTETVQALLQDKRIEIDAADYGGRTALHTAATNGRAAVAEALVKAGATVDAVTDDGFTPLYNAAASGNAETVAVLLAAGASLDATGCFDKNTPLHMAAGLNRVESMLLLLQAGARLDRKNHRSQTVVEMATWKTRPTLEAWSRGEHSMQLERAALEVAMLAWSREVPVEVPVEVAVEVARLCGDYVYKR